ncbi:Protein NYNRIN, partial [Dictyocoela muelleri]
MFKDVKEYVNNSLTCKLFKKDDKDLQKFRLKIADPFSKVQIDVIDPLPKTLKGNKYIIVAVDLCTRWVEAKATKTKSSNEISKFLIDEIFLRHGSPLELVSD